MKRRERSAKLLCAKGVQKAGIQLVRKARL